jgi:hypothetical protein
MAQQLLILTSDDMYARLLAHQPHTPIEQINHISDAGRPGAWVIAKTGYWEFSAAHAMITPPDTYTIGWMLASGDPARKVVNNIYDDSDPHNVARKLKGLWDPSLPTSNHFDATRYDAVQAYNNVSARIKRRGGARPSDFTWGPNTMFLGMTMAEIVSRIAKMEDIPRDLALALVQEESHFDPYALSPAGAMGLTQLMPSTALELGVTNAWDIPANLHGGFKYLNRQFLRFGNWISALAAFHSGAGSYIHRGITPADHEYINRIERTRQVFLRPYLSELAHAITD